MAAKKSDSAKTKGGGAKKAVTAATGGGKEKSMSELASALAEKTGLTKAKAKEVLDAHADRKVFRRKTL